MGTRILPVQIPSSEEGKWDIAFLEIFISVFLTFF
jgi:hypothetical protein